MHFAHSKPEVRRKTNAEDIKTVWECICSSKVQKQNATFDKLIKSVSKETNLNDESSKRLIQNVEADGLIERNTGQSNKIVNNYNGSYSMTDYFTHPDFSKPYKKGDKDWYCFICHLAGEVISCYECFRSFHVNCYKDQNQNKQIGRQPHNRYNKSTEKFICYICEIKNETDENFSRKQVRKLLDFATHFIRKKSSWKDMLSIGFRNEIVKNEYLVYKYCDLDLIQAKIRDGRYNFLHELIDDAENFVHDVCILHGIYSDKADQARVLLREIKDEINEVQLCADCYINAKAKLAEWITKPCQPNHKLIWARQPGGMNFWPAKLITEKIDGFEVRYFGGNHERSLVKKSDTKSFNFRPEEVEIKHGSGFDRAWNEVKKLREKIEQGYYTHSSGESDLPDPEDEYSDELYLSERRTKGLSLLDHQNLANGSNYSVLSSLSSRRSTTLDRSRKMLSLSASNINGKVSFGSSGSRTKLNLKSPTTIGGKRRKTSRSGGPVAKRIQTNRDKSSISSFRNPPGRPSNNIIANRRNYNAASESDSDSSPNSDNDSDNSSSSVNMKSLNFKFSPKKSILRSPGVSAKSLRQNRKPSAKLSQLSATRYTSLSDRIKQDLSSTESSEYDPKDNRVSTRKRTRKATTYKTENSVGSQSKSGPYNTNKYRRSPPDSSISGRRTGSLNNVPTQNIRASTRRINKSNPNTTPANIKQPSITGRHRAVTDTSGAPKKRGVAMNHHDNQSASSSFSEDDDEDHDSSSDSREAAAHAPPPSIQSQPITGTNNHSHHHQNNSSAPLTPRHHYMNNKLGATNSGITVQKSSSSTKQRYSSDDNSSTDRCCSPDDGGTTGATTGFSRHRKQLNIHHTGGGNTISSNLASPGNNSSSSRILRGVAPADSTSSSHQLSMVNAPPNQGGAGPSGAASTSSQQSTSGGGGGVATVTAPTTNVSTTSPYPAPPTGSNANRQRINSGYNPMFMNQPPKRMVHKCVATTLPACNCQEKFEKKFEEEKTKLTKDHQTALIDLEKKLKLEFDETKTQEIKKVSDEIRTQMQELIDKEKQAAHEALALAEAKHNEALTNTKRRQWCRNCLKEAIYHCCWNTSYCSIQCQQEHWQKEHKRVCRRKR